MKYCTKSLLNLLFFIQDEQRLKEQFYPVFDTVLIWIDHIKPEVSVDTLAKGICKFLVFLACTVHSSAKIQGFGS